MSRHSIPGVPRISRPATGGLLYVWAGALPLVALVPHGLRAQTTVHIIVPELCSTGNEFQEPALGWAQELSHSFAMQHFDVSAQLDALCEVECPRLLDQDALCHTASTSFVGDLLAHLR